MPSMSQILFNRFNRKYFGNRLTGWKVIISDRFGGQGLCRSCKREIHIRDGMKASQLRKTLLHEMCHASGNGHHGPIWRSEMLRIAALGAPTKQEALAYQNSNKTYPASAILSEAYDAGMELPNTPWSKFRLGFAYPYGLVDKWNRPESHSVVLFLRQLQRQFYAGQRFRRQQDI